MTTKKKNDLTRPAKFSLESWIDGTSETVDTARVTKKPHIAAKITKLDREKAEIESAEKSLEGTSQTKRRLAQKNTRKDRIKEIEAEIAELLPQLDGSWAEIQVRALSPQEEDKFREQRIKPGFEMVCQVYALTAQIREEGTGDEGWAELTAEEWAELFDLIGISQFQVLDRTAGNLTYAQAVTPDFSERFSQYRRTEESA